MGINISVSVDNQDPNKSTVDASGTLQHIITDEERSTFKLNDSQLKAAVKEYFGKAPNDAYLHSPTPWNDLYKRYNWDQVSTILKVEKAEILGITSEPTIIKSQEFINNSSSSEATYNVAISETVTNTASSSWSTGGTLSFSEEVKFNFFLGEASASMSYSQSWGVGGEHSESIAVGSEAGVQVTLQPGEGIIAQLTANRGVMKVRVTYKAYLDGTTAINYNPTYKDHHFWGLPLPLVMSAGNANNSIITTEDIEIGYFSESRIEIKDIKTKALISTYNLVDLPGK
jgi:hypothetical protein